MRQMLGMAGRVANGVMLSDMPPALAVSAMQTARETAAIKGRDPEALWFSSFTAWHVYANGEDAEKEARRWLLLRGLFRPWVLAEFLEADEIDLIMASQPAFLQAFVAGAHEIEGVPEEVLEKIVANLTLTASSDNLSEVIAELCRYKALGLSSISLRLYADPAASIDLLAEQVLPHLKG